MAIERWLEACGFEPEIVGARHSAVPVAIHDDAPPASGGSYSALVVTTRLSPKRTFAERPAADVWIDTEIQFAASPNTLSATEHFGAITRCRTADFAAFGHAAGREPSSLAAQLTVVIGIGSRLRQAPAAAEGLSQYELDLRIETAQIVVRPALHCPERRFINPERERFALRHSLFRPLVSSRQV